MMSNTKHNPRLHYLDWLRVIAFALLIVYHAAAGFFPDNFWLITSPHTSGALEAVMEHPRVWRLSLLFFISGAGTYFAFRTKDDFVFAKDRAVRLVVPLLFAMCVICVPQVWYERMLEDGYQGNFLEFWTGRYFLEGKYPTGHFTWAHMWFVGYLAAITAAFFPIMKLLDTSLGETLNGWFRRAMGTRLILVFFLLPLAFNLLLSPWFPRQTNALYNDIAWVSVHGSWFALGYLFARNVEFLTAQITKRRWEITILAVVLSAVMYGVCWTDVTGINIGTFKSKTALYKFFELFLANMMIYLCLLIAIKFLNFKNSAIEYLNTSIYPLYIIHQTVVVGLLYYAIRLEIGFYSSLILVISGTFLISISIYHFIVRNLGAGVILFGLPYKISDRIGRAKPRSGLDPRPDATAATSAPTPVRSADMT